MTVPCLLHETGVQEYGVFGHAPDRKFFDFEQIRQEIEDETDRHLKKMNGRVVSPGVWGGHQGDDGRWRRVEQLGIMHTV